MARLQSRLRRCALISASRAAAWSGTETQSGQEVYEAHDQVLRRAVALKVPKNSSAEKRFARSAALSARVNHPNIAKTLDYFEERGSAYLVEELVEGRDLKRVLADEYQLLDPYLAAHVLHHLARGVSASHHAGVVHRDLKPSNVMVSSGPDLAELKITDFGIAVMAEEEMAEAVAGGEETITGSQTMVGAIPYMSPEMVEAPRDADTPTDIWSIGAMTFELLTGDKPFGTGLPAVKRIIMDEIPWAPRFLRSKPQFKELGIELFDLLKRCLQKTPADRPKADELAESCSRLCYPTTRRRTGIVREYKTRTWGFIDPDHGANVFDSVYGSRPNEGDRVAFSCFSGGGADRAHPVVKMRN
jgi:serine/threonine protein kinase